VRKNRCTLREDYSSRPETVLTTTHLGVGGSNPSGGGHHDNDTHWFLSSIANRQDLKRARCLDSLGKFFATLSEQVFLAHTSGRAIGVAPSHAINLAVITSKRSPLRW